MLHFTTTYQPNKVKSSCTLIASGVCSGYNDDNNDGTLTFATVGSFFKGIDYCSHYYKSSKNGQSNRFERRDFDETTVNYVMAPNMTLHWLGSFWCNLNNYFKIEMHPSVHYLVHILSSFFVCRAKPTAYLVVSFGNTFSLSVIFSFTQF